MTIDAVGLDTTTTKRTTQTRANPRDKLREIIRANKSKSEDKWRKLFTEAVEDDTHRLFDGEIALQESYLRVIVDHFFDHTIQYLLSYQGKKDTPEQLAVKVQNRESAQKRSNQVKEQLKAQVRKEAEIMLLEMMMPNGKALGQCTGQECRKFGGWLAEIGKVVPANKLVSDTLSESAVRKLMQRK